MGQGVPTQLDPKPLTYVTGTDHNLFINMLKASYNLIDGPEMLVNEC